MPTKTPDDRFKPEARLAKAQADLADAQRARADAALRHFNGDSAARAEMIALEDEMDDYLKDISRLQAALTVATREQTTAEREQAEALELQRLADAERLGTEIEATAAQVIKVFDDLAPLLAKIDRLTNERSGLAWSVLRNRLDERRLDGMRNRVGAATPTGVLLAAIQTSGLGQVGPRLDPFVTFNSVNAGTPEQALAYLHERLKKEQTALLEATGRLPKAEPVNTIATTEEATHE